MVAVVVLAVVALVIVYFVGVYNGLVRLKNQIDNGFAQIDVQLKRRHDLIGNLLEVAKAYLSHESESLIGVTNARNIAKKMGELYKNNPTNDNLFATMGAENSLSSALGGFYATVENYPDLKADNLLKQVMDELTNTENRIGFARQHYNDSVMFYNNKREEFPNNIISGFFMFDKKAQLAFEDSAAFIKAPTLTF